MVKQEDNSNILGGIIYRNENNEEYKNIEDSYKDKIIGNYLYVRYVSPKTNIYNKYNIESVIMLL